MSLTTIWHNSEAFIVSLPSLVWIMLIVALMTLMVITAAHTGFFE